MTHQRPHPDAATASPWLLVAAYGDGPLVGSRQGHRGVIRDAVRIGSRRWKRINRRSIGARSRGTGNDQPMTHQRRTKHHERRTSPPRRRHCVAVAPCSGLRRRPTRRLATRAPRRDSGCGSYRFETMGKDQPPFHRCPQSWHGATPGNDHCVAVAPCSGLTAHSYHRGVIRMRFVSVRRWERINRRSVGAPVVARGTTNR